MTAAEIRQRVEAMKRLDEGERCGWDDEAAHSEEDAIRDAALKAIAAGAPDAQAIAAEALRTADYDFHRWCA